MGIEQIPLSRRFGYIRVSTDKQKYDRQKYILELYKIPKQNVFVEKISGKISALERPSFKKMLNKMKAGDVLFIASIDRLGRNLVEQIRVKEFMIKNGFGIFSDKERLEIILQLNPRTGKKELPPVVSFTFNLLSMLAENEREILAERTREGIQAKREQGVVWGRPSKYTDEEKANWKADFYSGMSLKKVSEKYGVPYYTIASLARDKWKTRKQLKEEKEKDQL